MVVPCPGAVSQEIVAPRKAARALLMFIPSPEESALRPAETESARQRQDTEGVQRLPDMKGNGIQKVGVPMAAE